MFVSFFKWLAKVLTGDVVGRIFDVIDKKIASKADKERLKAEVTQTWLRNRIIIPPWFDAIFIGFLGFYWAGIIVYSMFWCAGCVAPQSWSIAALPPPMDQWAGWIILSRFGAGVIGRFGR